MRCKAQSKGSRDLRTDGGISLCFDARYTSLDGMGSKISKEVPSPSMLEA